MGNVKSFAKFSRKETRPYCLIFCHLPTTHGKFTPKGTLLFSFLGKLSWSLLSETVIDILVRDNFVYALKRHLFFNVCAYYFHVSC